MRVLVVDDTIVFRKIISDALEEISGVEVVGKAGNGKMALKRIKDLQPDIITLDIEMPEMNGIEVLEVIKREKIDVGVIVLSAFTVKGGEMTVKALQLGAFDFITKPDSGTVVENRDAIKNTLSPIVSAWKQRCKQKNLQLNRQANIQAAESGTVQRSIPEGSPVTGNKSAVYTPDSMADLGAFIHKIPFLKKPEIIVIGVSTGGPAALGVMLPKISANIGVPILIVQHMPPLFTQSLAKSLNAKCQINVKEAEEGENLVPGTAYIAPGGKQMKISASASGKDHIIRVTNDPPENNCKPAVDYMFRSVVSFFPGKITAVVMTGMGSDGTVGMRLIKRHGGISIVQDEKSCVVYGMPMEVVKAGAADLQVPLDMISDAIEKSVRRSGK
ncbi:MAG: chemotaxis response regulator protein-glutamate methylesterase [Spirochaetales bacterium]|nr:chemotaxis response regulator protein-glutamate methylesterase [Spirochaetales bacterium]